MGRRLRYQVAVSLDGFIAGPNGEYDWIVIDPAVDFAALFKEFDTAVMGRKTYDLLTAQGGDGAMPGLDVMVFSRTLPATARPGVRILNDDPREIVAALKAKPGRDIWLFAGASSSARSSMQASWTPLKLPLFLSYSELACRCFRLVQRRNWFSPTKGKLPADWNHLLRTVSRFLTLALEDKWHPLRRQVMARFPVRVETDREPDLTVEDFIRTTALISEPLRPAYWAIAILGLRIGEFCALTRLNLRPKSYTVQVPGSKTKGSTRVLPVDPRLWSWIEAAVPCPVTHWHLRNIWWKARVKAGIGDVRPHDLRHAMAQWSTDAGADLPMIQAQLGHATVQMTGRYAKRRLRAQHAKIMGDLLSVPQSVTSGHRGSDASL